MRFSLTQSVKDMTDEERLDWLQLIRTTNVGPIRFYELIDHFGSASNALAALPDLNKQNKKIKDFISPDRSIIKKEYEQIRRYKGQIITIYDDIYPVALSVIDDAPPVLTVKGNLALLKSPSIGVVGARNASIHGKKFTSKLAKELGKNGYAIISGLARGIDTAAHEGSLETGTIAVVAGGIDSIYPHENRDLHKTIEENGLVVAENMFGMAPRAQDFPRRNRIVSGLSQAIVVVEASERSGSLITARLAAEQGRHVYAVPGHPMEPRASGPNKLIREGATLVRHASDILEDVRNFVPGEIVRPLNPDQPSFLEPSTSAERSNEIEKMSDIHEVKDKTSILYADEKYQTPKSMQKDNESPQTVFDAITIQPILVDELITTLNLPTSEVQANLLELELQGKIKRLPGQYVVRINES